MGLKIEIEDIDISGKPTIIISADEHCARPTQINSIIYKLLMDCSDVVLNCNVDIINHLPDNIETIQLNNIVYYEYKPIEKYPKNLKKLIIYGKFDDYLAALPIGLETLIIDNKITKNLNNLPPTITHLELDCNYDGIIEYPCGLKYLKLNTNCIDHLATLPPNLETFILLIEIDNTISKKKKSNRCGGNDNYKMLFDNINSLPDNIKSFTLYMHFAHHLDNSSGVFKIKHLPEQLESLKIDYCHPDYLDLTSLPENLNKIIINYAYYYDEDIVIKDFEKLFKSFKPDIEIVNSLHNKIINF